MSDIHSFTRLLCRFWQRYILGGEKIKKEFTSICSSLELMLINLKSCVAKYWPSNKRLVIVFIVAIFLSFIFKASLTWWGLLFIAFLSLFFEKASSIWLCSLFIVFMLFSFFKCPPIYLILFFIFLSVWFCKRREYVDKRIIIEGVLIGIVVGVFGSYVTDNDFKASINGPIIEARNRISKYKSRYASKDWGNINAKWVGDGVVDVSATKIASVTVVTFDKATQAHVPADLWYAVATGDVAGNGTILNIVNPEIKTENIAGSPIVAPEFEKKQ